MLLSGCFQSIKLGFTASFIGLLLLVVNVVCAQAASESGVVDIPAQSSNPTSSQLRVSEILTFRSYGFPIYCPSDVYPKMWPATSQYDSEVNPGCLVTPSPTTPRKMWQIRMSGALISDQVVPLAESIRSFGGNKRLLKTSSLTEAEQKERLKYLMMPAIAGHLATIDLLDGDRVILKDMLRTEENGHFNDWALIDVPSSYSAEMGSDYLMKYRVSAVDDGGDGSTAITTVGECVVMEGNGVSVISDIDETLKSFGFWGGDAFWSLAFQKYEAFPGMPEFMAFLSNGFASLKGSPTSFTYVSGAFWQLIPGFERWFAEVGYPKGTFAVNRMDVPTGPRKVPAVLRTGAMSSNKYSYLAGMIKNCPLRTFVLVGDTALGDPKLYSKLLREFPKERVPVALLKTVKMGILNFRSSKWFVGRRFKGLDKSRYRIFTDVSELQASLDLKTILGL